MTCTRMHTQVKNQTLPLLTKFASSPMKAKLSLELRGGKQIINTVKHKAFSKVLGQVGCSLS